MKAKNFTANETGQALDKNDFIIYNTTTGALLYDRDGNGKAAAVEFAGLLHAPKVTAGDFFVVK